MHPVLFHIPDSVPVIGGFTINSFGVMLYLAFVAGGFVWQSELNRKGLPGEKAWDLVLWALVGGLVGAKLYWAFWNFRLLAADPLGTLFSGAGLTWYGGLFLGFVLVWVALRRMKLPVAKVLDGAAVALPLSIAIGRIGCFLAGDDYGKPTASWVGIAFPHGYPPTRVDVLRERFGYTPDPELVRRFGDVLPVHPTQLYDVAMALIVFAIVFRMRKHSHRAGWLFAFWAALYSVERFVLEVFRIKDDRIFFGTFTIAQLLSLIVGVLAVLVLFRLREPPDEAGVQKADASGQEVGA